MRRLHILLVEDNLLNAKLIAVLFAPYGIKLEFAENGMQAIEKIKVTHFDIILMDMEMPVMNGYEATTIIRQQLKINIPIVALTAHALPGEKEKCMLLGMDDYILKPIQEDLLFKTIYKLTSSSKSKTGSLKTKRSIIRPAAVKADKVCNMGYLIGVSHGNNKIMNNIVAVFFKETRKELTFLSDAIEKTNYTVISDISHKIKSAFSILGISVLEPVFKEMEQLSGITSPIVEIELLNRRINMVFNQAKAEMNSKN